MQNLKTISLALASIFILVGCGEAVSTSSFSSEENVDQKSIGNIIVNNTRIQLLDDQTIRFESKRNGEFLDENTFFVPNRHLYEGVFYSDYREQDNHIITFNDFKITVPYTTNNLRGITIEKNNQIIYESNLIRNNGSLPSPSNTPDAFPLCDSPRIIVPETGYSIDSYYSSSAELEDTSGYDIQNDAQDLYVLLPLKDAKKLRQAYVNLTGKSEMIRLANLGTWDSKYFAYSDVTAQEEIDNYKKYNLPLDNLVIDTDWRRSSATGIGYDINTNLFPDMEGFLQSVHDQNIEVMFNDHPEPFYGTTTLLSANDIEYRNESLKKLLEIGLDTWWYDRNWTTSLSTPTRGTINPETWGLYLYHDITKQHYQNVASNQEIYRRPVVMGNADNIYHGKYQGINNTASHRYSIQWTGDINADSGSLSQEIADIIRAGSDSLPYLSSDIGGHNGNPTNELYTRWVQYGTLSPIFRPHSSKYNQRYRQPWLYGEDALNISREYINLRYRLMPLYYALSFENYQTGMPLIRSLEFNYPDDGNARRNDEYLIGNNILFAPITDDIYNVVPNNWYSGEITAKYYNNKTLSGPAIYETKCSSINFNWGTNCPYPGGNGDNFSASFEGKIIPEKDSTLAIKVDDGVRVYIDGALKCDKFFANDSITYDVFEVKKGTTYDIKVEYYEDAGNALVSLYYKNNATDFTKDVYLPSGSWMNVFTGEVFEGNQTISVTCDLRSSPLFIRLGSITPLVDTTLNTALIDWNSLVYDVYPSKNSNDQGFVYEDDHQTTAYKYGQYRTSNYSYRYDENENAVIILLDKSSGEFEGSNETELKKYSVRYHLVNGMNSVKKVTINDKLVSTKYHQLDKYAFPFNSRGGSVSSDVLEIELETNINVKNEIKIYLG